MTMTRKYAMLKGEEREAAKALAARLYVGGNSIKDIMNAFDSRERPLSFGTVRSLLHEAGVTLRPPGGQARTTWVQSA